MVPDVCLVRNRTTSSFTQADMNYLRGCHMRTWVSSYCTLI